MMDIQTIANSTFNSEHSVMGLHKLLLTEEEHKALTDTLKNHEKLKEENNKLRRECAKHKHDFANLWKSHQDEVFRQSIGDRVNFDRDIIK